jgi:esterase/lipase superfamily enzyme
VTRGILVVCVALLVACTPRGAITLAPDAARVGEVTPVFIGTTRQPARDGFGPEKSEALHFARYDISIPTERNTGEINWPTRLEKPNPKRHFLTSAEVIYADEKDFRAGLRQDLAQHDGEAVIFIHGYNNNFAEGLYRVAQFAHDLDLPGSVIHYAWPSVAKPLGYVTDRDSALFARDGLEGLINEVAAAGAKRILIVAHSMGSGLTMEALRQTAIRGDQAVIDRLAGVILISPDIDVDVFRTQAHAIGQLPQPFLIFGSNRDRLLGLSARLTGQSERLGSLTDVTRVADLKVTFFDVGEFSEGAGHFTVGNSPALIRLLESIGLIEGAFEDDRVRRIGLVSGAVLTVQNATQIILSPVAEIAAEVSR